MQRLDTAALRGKEKSTIVYLVGDTSRFNNGKYAEQRDRVKHSLSA